MYRSVVHLINLPWSSKSSRLAWPIPVREISFVYFEAHPSHPIPSHPMSFYFILFLKKNLFLFRYQELNKFILFISNFFLL